MNEETDAEEKAIYRQSPDTFEKVANTSTVPIPMLLVGSSAVGKTSLLARYAHGVFNEVTDATVSAAFTSKVIKGDDGCKLKLQVWDTAGAEVYRSIGASYIRRSKVVIVCGDVTKRETLREIQEWIKRINLYGGSKVPRIIVGNKCDLVDQRQWGKEDVLALNLNPQPLYFDVSALDNVAVDEMFLCAAKLALEQIDTDVYTGAIRLSAPGPRTNRRCC